MRKIKLISIIIIIEFLLSSIIMWFFAFKNEAQAITMSSSYTQYVKSGVSAFPKSYQPYLKSLAELHPNWTFKAYNTGIDRNELISASAENKCKKNTIYFKSGTTLLDAKALCECGQYGDTNYYDASATTVNFYLDPRNFLTEATIFQFLDLSYDENITKAILESAVKNSFLNGKFKLDGKEYTYVDVILDAAKEADVSAMHVAVTIIQELGTGTKQSDGSYSLPTAVSGKAKGYEGLYNFFNYGATDGTTNGMTPTQKGLAKAKTMGWTDPIKALKGGTKTVLANSYIGMGQSTKYFYKFDVVGNEILKESMGKKTYDSKYFFSHQYMTNIQDPSSQAYSLFKNYNNNSLLYNKLSFTIPVYTNMPETASLRGTSFTEKDGTLYQVTADTGVNVRKKASSSSDSYGTVARGTIVAVTDKSGDWLKVKVNKAGTHDAKTKKWSSTNITGYIYKTYLTKIDVKTDDTGTDGDAAPVVVPTTTEIKVAPGAKVKTITAKYATATIKDANGKSITGDSTAIGTGYVANIEKKNYLIIMLGDVNCDTKLSSSDLLGLVKHLNETKKFKNEKLKAADVNKDGKVSSSDLLAIVKHLSGTKKITA